MSEQTNLLNEYYSVTEPAKRTEILNTLISQNEDIDSRIIELNKKRYNDKGNDLFLKAFLDLTVTKSDASFMTRKFTQKTVNEDMQFLEISNHPDEFLIKEWEHLSRFYIQLCARDNRFSTAAFGLTHLKEEQVIQKIFEQFEHATQKVPAQFGLEEEFGMFRKSFTKVYDEYRSFKENANNSAF